MAARDEIKRDPNAALIATHSFAVALEGAAPRVVNMGQLVRPTDPIVKGREQLFEQFNPEVHKDLVRR